MKAIEMTGKNVDLAVQAALKELDVMREQVDVEILETSGKKFLGIFGDKPAKVRVTVVRECIPSVAAEMADPVKTVFSEPIREKKTERRLDKTIDKRPERKIDRVNETKPESKNDFKSERKVEKKVDFKSERKEKLFVADEAAIAASKVFLENIFQSMELKVLMEKRVGADGVVVFNLHGEDLGILIGKHGQTLDSLQYLANLVANKQTQERVKIIIDIENYRQRRVDTLTVLAKKIASQVKRTQQKVMLEPMSPHERKIIHMALQDDRRIVTNSEGEEPHRYVVIELK